MIPICLLNELPTPTVQPHLYLTFPVFAFISSCSVQAAEVSVSLLVLVPLPGTPSRLAAHWHLQRPPPSHHRQLKSFSLQAFPELMEYLQLRALGSYALATYPLWLLMCLSSNQGCWQGFSLISQACARLYRRMLKSCYGLLRRTSCSYQAQQALLSVTQDNVAVMDGR